MITEKPGTKVNPLEYPVGYFDAQVIFAKKWSELTSKDFVEVALRRTALYRRLFGAVSPQGEVPKEWVRLIQDAEGGERGSITESLYGEYSANPANVYLPKKESSAFGYDFDDQTKTVKVHFTNPNRGERPLSEENMPKRREEFRKMLEEVRRIHPSAAKLISATWLRSTDRYQSFSPQDRSGEINLMKRGMKLTGNSVWGQFMDANGNTNWRVYNGFVEAVAVAADLDELVDAFPYKTMLASDPISTYYEHYGVG